MNEYIIYYKGLIEMLALQKERVERARLKREKDLHDAVHTKYEKENNECTICKLFIQRKCLDNHQTTQTCKKKGLLLDVAQMEDYTHELKEKQRAYCKPYYEHKRKSYISTE